MTWQDVRSRIRLLAALALTMTLTLVATSPAEAGLVIGVQLNPSTALAGSTNNTFDVTLTNNGGSAVTIGGFAFQLSVASGSGLSFTSVDISTSTAPYIFNGHSAFGPDITNQPIGSSLPGTLIAAEDNYDISGSGFSVAAGATVGLGDVHFDLASNALRSILITLAPFPITNLSDASGVDFTTSAGTTLTNATLTVGSSAVPEPSSLVLTGMALTIGLGLRRVRRRGLAGA